MIIAEGIDADHGRNNITFPASHNSGNQISAVSIACSAV
jgi:metal-dependent HD superfamily phosphatase/phosphodiesterase